MYIIKTTHTKSQPINFPNYTFNIKNTTQLIQSVKETSVLPTYKFASIDISNMYSTIPITKTRHIFNNIMKFNLSDPHTNQELLIWYVTITKQNYFTNKSNMGPGQLSRHSDSLQAGRSGEWIPVVARFSAHVQTRPGAHPTSYKMGTASPSRG